MQRTLLHSVLFSMLSCAFVACGNDQPKSTTDSGSTAQTKTPEAKTPKAEEATTAKKTEAHAPDAKDAKAASAPAKPTDAKPAAADAAKSETPADPNVDPAIAKMREFIASKIIDKKAPNWRT
jgi:hypothetical protein